MAGIIYGVTHRWYPDDREVDDVETDVFYLSRADAQAVVDQRRAYLAERQLADWTRQEESFQSEKAKRNVLVAAGLEKPNAYYARETHKPMPTPHFQYDDYVVSEHELR